jgi:hypothetical protein
MKNQPLTSQLRLTPYIKLFLVAAAVFILSACSNMETQGRYQPLQESAFFPDGRSARPPAPGSLPFGIPEESDVYFTGLTEDGMFVETMPLEISLEMLERGRERYDIFCAPCHGLDGYGQGMIVQRGFPAPQSFHIDRIRQAPDGHIYSAIANGFGRMFAYGYRVPPADRWAITAYVRVLQFSQQASIDQLPPDEQLEMEGNQP